jgi:hypothetical protein
VSEVENLSVDSCIQVMMMKLCRPVHADEEDLADEDEESADSGRCDMVAAAVGSRKIC